MKLFKMIFVLLLLLVSVQARTLTILHYNDFHGHIAPFKMKDVQYGGGAALATLIRQKVKNDRNCLVLSAGDTISGSSEVNPFNGRPSVELMNMFPNHASAIGNHELDFGLSIFRRRASEANFPFLAANMAHYGEPVAEHYKIFDIDGVKVAVLGLATPDTLTATNPAGTIGVTFEDPVVTASRYVPFLRSRADLVVALTHLGMEEDVRLAKEVSGIDIIIGGHSHTLLEAGYWVGETLIAQAGMWGANLGVIEVHVPGNPPVVTGRRARLIPVLADMPVDKDLAEFAAQQKHIGDLVMGQVVGYTSDALGLGINLRDGENSLSRWACDAVREQTGADIVLFNSGGMRQGIPAGDISVRDITNTFPFNNTVVMIELSGNDIKKTLEFAMPVQGKGTFPQISGAVVEADVNGKNVDFKKIEIAGEPIDLNRMYKLATSSFQADGGDGYVLFAKAERVKNPAYGQTIVTVLKNWLEIHKEVKPSEPGRMKVNFLP